MPNAESPRLRNHLYTTFLVVIGGTVFGPALGLAQTDANGSLHAHDGWTYTYDVAQRLRRSVAADGREVRYEYDGLGQLVAQETCNPAGVCTRTDLILDEAGPLPRILGAAGPGSNARFYAWGPEGLAAEALPGSESQRPLLDHQRSVRGFAERSGVVTQHRIYDAWGRPLQTADPARDAGGHLGFTGEWHNPDGTMHLRARTYHPALHRFLQRDRYGGTAIRPASLHRYAYAENDPLTFTDPTGFAAERERCSEELLAAQRGIDTSSLSLGLTGVGDVPAAALDILSAGMSAHCGDYWGAVLSAGGALPIIGLTANAAKVARRGLPTSPLVLGTRRNSAVFDLQDHLDESLGIRPDTYFDIYDDGVDNISDIADRIDDLIGGSDRIDFNLDDLHDAEIETFMEALQESGLDQALPTPGRVTLWELGRVRSLEGVNYWRRNHGQWESTTDFYQAVEWFE